jgi:trigger factor
MTASIKETSSTVRNVEITIPQDALKAPFEKKVTQYRKEVQLKGFRAGSTPRHIVVSRFGKMIRQECVEDLMNSTLSDELKKANIIPVSRVKVENFKDDEKSDISFTAIVEVDPEIDIKGYENLGISVPAVAVSEDEVKDELNRVLQMYSTAESVDRESKKGDVVVGNYINVKIDGEEKEIPEDREFRTLLGESSSPGFDEGLTGVKKGISKDIHFVYPADHKDEQYRGKTADFKVEVTDVREIRAPKMDAEFFAKIGVKDEAELKDNVQTGILNNKKNQAKNKAVNEAIDKLIESNPFDVPHARVIDLIKYTLKRSSGTNEDVEPTEEELKSLEPEAVREIKKHRILEFIANKEKLKPSQATVDARVEDIARSYGVDGKTLKEHFRQTGRMVGIREELRIGMAADLIVGIKSEEAAK